MGLTNDPGLFFYNVFVVFTILVTGNNSPPEKLTVPDDYAAGRNLVP